MSASLLAEADGEWGPSGSERSVHCRPAGGYCSPRPAYIWFTEHTHPPVELRIERLRGVTDTKKRPASL